MNDRCNLSSGAEEEKTIPFLKTYSVFNAEQIEGLDAHYYAKPEPVIDSAQRVEHAERFFAGIGSDIRHGGGRTFFSGGSDHVQMPPFECFRSPESYYATVAHELTHWTKHKTRLDRDLAARIGATKAAREELVVELGAAFLCADLALTPEAGAEHAAYIQSWLKVLQEDKRAIFSAAAHAQRAADFLNGLQPKREEGGIAA